MSVSSILKKLYPMDRKKRYPMDLHKRRRNPIAVSADGLVVGLRPDGTTVNCSGGNSAYDKENVWSVSFSANRVVHLKTDGTFDEFENLVDATYAYEHPVGLKADGTCVTKYIYPSMQYGDKTDHAKETIETWQDIVSLSSGNLHIIGLKSDGTCVFYRPGNDSPNLSQVLDFQDIVQVSCAQDSVLGLKADGTCVAAGTWREDVLNEVLGWKDIIFVTTGNYTTIGLKADGTCVTAGSHYAREWKDIVAISSIGDYSSLDKNRCFAVGLKADGTCVSAPDNKTVASWHLMQYSNQGLLTATQPINLLDKTSVSGFTIKGIEPANTKRRVTFKVEDKWNKLSAEGALTPLTTQEITADSVLEEGNTVAELEAITTTTGLAGKLIYPAVALYAEPEAEVMPTFGMTVKAEIDTTVNVYSYTGYSQEYNLSAGEDVQVVNVVAETETTGEGNVVVTARLKQGGEWTDYMALSDTAMKQASALQLKAVYTVTNTDGSQSAKVKNVTIRYTTSGATVNGVSTDIVTKTQRFTNDLVYAHCYVKHKKLQDAVIDAYCSLRKRPKSKSMYQFGNGTGSLKTYKLPDAGINQDTLSVYVDGKVVYDFGYNTETSEITLTADKDTALSASYECGYEMSNWIPMTQGVSQVNDSGGYTTEYSYTVPTHEGYEYTVTAIKYSLVRPEGTVTEETIGVGTGKRQMIELPHFAKKETIVCNGAWSYDYDRKLLTIIAPEGEDIVISYDWIAETPTVYAVSAGWAD